MNPTWPAWGIGTIIALVVLILSVILLVLGHELDNTLVYGLVAALAVARLT